jgi:hypothetical protein
MPSNQKVFINLYFEHLSQKSNFDRKCRLRFFSCGLDLLKNTRHAPESKPNVDNKQETLHRFYGLATSGEIFCVQVRENKRGALYFMSTFPII